MVNRRVTATLPKHPALSSHNDCGGFCFQVRMPKGPTVPKPFNLSQGNKRKHEETASEYVSLAEQVEAFQKRTPSRYHLRSRKSEEGEHRLDQPQRP